MSLSFIRLPEVLVLAVPSGREAVVINDTAPKEPCGFLVSLVSRIDVSHQRTIQLWNLRVAVRVRDDVFVLRERIDDRFLMKLIGEREPAGIGGVGIQLGQNFVHSAEFSA